MQVSPQDQHLLDEGKWHITQAGYVRRSVPLDGERFLHRIIMRPEDGLEVDHVNGDPLDNRRENLRVVDRQTNAFARKMPARDLPRGVSFTRGKYQASIRVDGYLHYLGRYDTAARASEAYAEAAIVHFGEAPPA